MSKEKAILKGRSTIRAYPAGSLSDYPDKSIEPIYEQTVSNLIVTSGKAMIAEALRDGGDIELTYHAIGTSATVPALTDIALGTEAARKAWTTRVRTGTKVLYEVFYLASEATFNIAEAGVFGGPLAGAGAGTGTLFSHYLQPYDNSAGSFDITFEYELEVQ